MHDANDKDADTCTMSVDGQSDDDGNHVSERGGDRRQECDRSNLSDASEHEHDDDEDIEDTGTVDASIAMDIEDESDDGERTMERGDPNGEQPTSDEDDDGDDADDDDDDDEADAVPVCSSCNGLGHKTRSSHKCPNHICKRCKESGHNQSNCPEAQCTFCGLFGHVRKRDCKYQHCSEVEVDWFNILFAVSTRHTIDSLFAKNICTIHPNNLRIDGKFKEFSDWDHVERICGPINAEALLQLKRIARDFKNDRTREYENVQRKLNKRTEAPINFAMKHDYEHESVAKCKFCRAWLFWPETSQKEWCCGQGKYLPQMNPWTQPTDEFRELCIGTSTNAKLFRANSRKLNNENSFASWGVKWGQEAEEKYPNFLKVSGVTYYRLLHGDAKGPLQSYIRDVDYHYDGLKLPVR